MSKIESIEEIQSRLPVWAWNGYNGQWVENANDPDYVRAEAQALAERKGDDATLIYLEDGDFVTINVWVSYDFYGHRWANHIFTTRPGSIDEDEEDNLVGDWVPA